jgi:restriction endonuclease Mrr
VKATDRSSIRHPYKKACTKFHSQHASSEPKRGSSTRFVNLVAWVLARLNEAKAVTRIKKGIYRVTDRGRAIFKRNPGSLTLKELMSE